jgi:quinol monooxygenase YgiN
MTTIVTAIFHPLDGHTAELIDALQSTIPAVHDEDGCRLYAIHEANNGTITMIEKWDTPEQLAAHASGAAVALLEEAVANHIASPTTVTTMTPISAGKPEKGIL